MSTGELWQRGAQFYPAGVFPLADSARLSLRNARFSLQAVPPQVRRHQSLLSCCAAVFAIGLLARIVRLPMSWHIYGPAIGVGEPVQVAISLVTTGRYADAYGPGTGPTAHCAPLQPLLLSLLFRIFGTGFAAAVASSIVAAAEAALAFALLPALGVAGRLGLRTGAVAGFAGAMLPVNYGPQTAGVFEAPLTAVALAALCTLICRAAMAGRFRRTQALLFGVACGAASLLNPVVIAVVAAWFVVCAFQWRLRLRRVALFFATAALTAGIVTAPWAIRNYFALGSPIWTRSNFGLELQISNNGLTTADLERNLRGPYFQVLHPFLSDFERAKVRALGEVAYQKSKKEEALAWIATHRQRFLALTAERAWLFWFPEMGRRWQWIFEAALTLSALGGLALLFRRKHPFAWFAAAALAAYPAVYYIIQASARYRFPIEPILFLLAAYLAVEVAQRSSLRRSRARLSAALPIRRASRDAAVLPEYSRDRV